MSGQPPLAVRRAKLDSRVERTLLSAAFDFAFELREPSRQPAPPWKSGASAPR
jgi:hypothetical protein